MTQDSRPKTHDMIDEIIETYEAVLIDAYGVLVHSSGAYPGAAQFLKRLQDSGTDYLIVTNDASRLPDTCADRYALAGVDVDADRVLTSGLLITPHLRGRDVTSGPVSVLGTNDTRAYLIRDDYRLVEPGDDRARAVILGDEAGYDFISAVEATLSMLTRAIDADRPVELVCPNPDRLYPRGPGRVGFTSGAIAALFEDALRTRFPGQDIAFARLGKPHPALYKRAIERLETENVAMIGDKLSTDIRGAVDFGIDSVWVTADVADPDRHLEASQIEPTRTLDSLE